MRGTETEQPDPPGPERIPRIAAVLSLLVFAGALFALQRILHDVHPGEVFRALREIPAHTLLPALLCVAGSYLALAGYDAVALRHLGRSLPLPQTAFASFTAYAFSNNIGLSLLTGGTIRYRIYSAMGLSVTEVATLTALCSMTFGLGVTLLLGVTLVVDPGAVHTGLASEGALRAVGGVLLLGLTAYTVWGATRREPITIGNWRLPAPPLSVTLTQFALGAVDITLAAGALYLLMPPGFPLAPMPFVGLFVVAISLGVLSHSPGGLGVFEATLLLGLPEMDPGPVLASLLLFRLLYYLLPLALAAAMLAWHTGRGARRPSAPQFVLMRRVSLAVAPTVIGTTVFAGGVILLFSAAIPGVNARIRALSEVVPLPFLELSHLLSSMLGVWLLFLSRGLFRRLRGAHHLAVGALAGGMLVSLLKGLDYEEAAILAVLMLVLVVSHKAFYRDSSLLSQRFSPAWVATIVAIIGAMVWLGLFSYRHVDYSSDLWWQFAYNGDASRFLRAAVSVVVLGSGWLLLSWMRPAIPHTQGATADPAALAAIVADATCADANLAFTGDKRFLMDEDARAFIMYQVQGRSWIAMGDPVGDRSAWPDLLWRFRELCDRYDGWPVFYQVDAEHLPLYLDMGLSPFKLGEQARVRLDAFSLEGPERREWRYIDKRFTRDGATFEVIPAARVSGVIGELRAVSEAWMRDKRAREKRFSVGAFSEAYLSRFDCAVVRVGGTIVAFANLWAAPAGGELSVDLMRQSDQAPRSVMDYLFVRTMLWGRDNGYRWLNMGMAPLSGLESHPLGPIWNRIGTLIFRNGEYFYNFEGLRSYKAKFGPEWTPKYLVVPGGRVLPRVLLDVTTLIAGGKGGIFRP
ncbi:MAG: bifunctional lysylphosphatidylglycerol flippase/synthetase MprF [Nitrospirota bacterium]|nr:bifunctional lysylphosphatidylglycerol flippase/synthetase MprF [Nitrospirota bacterium]